ncbi:amidohydrolase [Candidatus Bathyarchaeota archaeon]|nr:MAG: amidohydrolase [Candidatus Bathyarchaeota archaeon]
MSWWDRYYIIDAHAHICPRDDLFGVSMTADELRRLMRRYNYSKCIIMSRDNALVARAVRGSRDLLAHVWVNPKDDRCIETLRTYLKKEGFIGIKLHPLFDGYLPYQQIVYPVAAIAEEFDVPIQFHCGHPPFSLPWSFEPLAREFPKVKMILIHMGHGHIVYINGAIEVAERNPNIYLETSGMPMHTKIKEAVERVGRDRVLYGDDIPCGHPSWELEKVKAANLKEDDLRRVLGENAKKLYNLE